MVNSFRQFRSPPWHPGIHYANTVSEFLPTDTKESLAILCQVPEYRKYFKQNGWLEPQGITYKINKHGFRSDEFDQEDCIVALGCSFTIGIGLPVHSTWPHLVGTQLGLAPYNLAWGGTSADTCFRLAEYWVPKLLPRAVFMLTPPPARFELIRASGDIPVENYLPLSESLSATEIDSYLQHWFTAEENGRLNQTKNKLAIKSICNDLKIPCFVYDAFDWMAKSREEVGYARDRMHAGPPGHKVLAEKMLDDYRSRLG